MKKIFVLFGLIILLTGCGNKDMFDTEYTYDYAECYFGGEYQKIEIKKWTTYSDGEQLQIKDKDNNLYLVSMNYCRLVKE